MRTTVYTDADDTDETDEHPGCSGQIADNGDLVIIDNEVNRGHIEYTYGPDEWVGFETWTTD